MDSTVLNLLSRDGILTVEFKPSLDTTKNHYLDLYRVTKDANSNEADMRVALEKFASDKGLAVRFL